MKHGDKEMEKKMSGKHSDKPMDRMDKGVAAAMKKAHADEEGRKKMNMKVKY